MKLLKMIVELFWELIKLTCSIIMNFYVEILLTAVILAPYWISGFERPVSEVTFGELHAWLMVALVLIKLSIIQSRKK